MVVRDGPSEAFMGGGVQIYEKRCGEIVVSKDDGRGQLIHASVPNAGSSADADRAMATAPPGSPLANVYHANDPDYNPESDGGSLKSILKRPGMPTAGPFGGNDGVGMGSMVGMNMPMSPGQLGRKAPVGMDWDAIGNALNIGEYGAAYEEVGAYHPQPTPPSPFFLLLFPPPARITHASRAS